jgi:hypothetical protein
MMVTASALKGVASRRKRIVPIRAERPADSLERQFFICPRCGSLSSLVPNGQRLTCSACTYSVSVGEDGFLHSAWGEGFFDTPADWSVWQHEVFNERLKEASRADTHLFSEPRTILYKGNRSELFSRLALGEIRLFSDRITFSSRSGVELAFRVDLIEVISAVNASRLEIRYCDQPYSFDLTDPLSSSFKWVKAAGMLRDGMHLLAGIA